MKNVEKISFQVYLRIYSLVQLFSMTNVNIHMRRMYELKFENGKH